MGPSLGVRRGRGRLGHRELPPQRRRRSTGHEEHEHADQQQVAADVRERPLPEVRLAQREVHRANLFLQRLVARMLDQFSLEFEELRRVQRVLDLPPGVVDQQQRADDHREHARHPRRPRSDPDRRWRSFVGIAA